MSHPNVLTFKYTGQAEGWDIIYNLLAPFFFKVIFNGLM